jgi:hypothetical protein
MELSRETVKNLVDVLRTLNLTIAAVSLGLLSNIAIVSNNTPAHARPELHRLLNIRDQIGNYTADKLFYELAKQSGISAGGFEMFLSFDSPVPALTARPFVMSIQIPSVLHPGMSFTSEESKAGDFYWPPSKEIRSMETLGQFRWFWNALATYPHLLVLHPNFARCWRGTNSPGERILEPSAKVGNNVPLEPLPFYPSKPVSTEPFTGPIASLKAPVNPEESLWVAADWVNHDNQPVVRLSFYHDWVASFRDLISPGIPPKIVANLDALQRQQIMLDFSPDVLRVDPLKSLLSKCTEISQDFLKAKSFNQAFPNLGKLDEYYLTRKLSDLDGALNEESKRSQIELEIFGVKISSETIFSAGLASLVVFLLQFWLVCAYLAKHLTNINLSEASQWSFLLNWWPFALFGLATFLLPMLAALLSWTVPHGWLAAILPFPVLVLSALSAFNLWSLSRRVRVD